MIAVEPPQRPRTPAWVIACWMASLCSVTGRHEAAELHMQNAMSMAVYAWIEGNSLKWSPA